ARQLIGLTLDAEAFLHAGERHGTRHFGNDRVSVGIPLGHHLAGGDGIAILDGDDGAVGNLVALALAAIGIGHRQLAGAGHGHLVGLPLHQLDVEQAGSTAGFDLDVVHRGRPRCRATDVEGAHGQLGAGLADGLGGNHADRLPDVDLVAPGQVAAITLGTDAVAGLTGAGGAHTRFIDAHGLDALHPFLVDHGAGGHGDLVAAGLEHILGHHPAEDTVTQGFDDVATLDHRGHQQALGGAAVDAGDHHVLGHIHQAAGEVPGVGGLERGIRRALPGTVGGDEVLEYVQAFAEVGDDGGFDDGAVGTGHQAAHAGELTDLGRGAPGAGVLHHEHRVVGRLFHLVALAIDDLFLGDAFHHGLGHQVVGPGPDVDHLVVLLALGHQAGGEL